MVAGQQSQAESVWSPGAAEPIRRGRAAEAARRQAAVGGPAFISDLVQEQHHLDTIDDPATDEATRATVRLELARIYELRGQFSEAAEMYERNVWAGVRTPATFAGLAAAYRQIGREDLAEATLEQVRRQGGAARTADTPAATRRMPAAVRAQPAAERAQPTASRRGAISGRATRTAGMAAATPANATAARRGQTRTVRSQSANVIAASGAVIDQIQQSVAPFLEGQAGRRTLIVSTVLLPIVIGLGVFVGVVFTSARPRAAELAAAPTPAPVATVAPTPAAPPAAAPPTPAIPAALSQPPAAARLIVSNVGGDGLSLRRTPNATGQRIKVWKDGTEMANLGDTAQDGGMTWRKVRDPDGNVGWTAADYLAEPGAQASAPAVPAAPAFTSGGLGLTRAEWEKAHGKPSQSSIFLEYDSGRLVVGLLESNVWHIERVWKGGEAVTLDQAREDARAYLPADATVTQSIDKGDGRIVDVYTSPSLTARFGSTAWNGGKAGTFSIQYRFRSPADRMVISAMFRLGDAQF
ncbi:MAG: tetratricopeptide repeat protein [Chloroflexota bacterium]